MRRYFYDFEFLEDGVTIELISVGIVCDDGREYYAVNMEMPVERIMKRRWLMDNVWPHLPLAGDGRLNMSEPEVKPRKVIAGEVRDFLLRPNEAIELWGYYASYDHVLMSQLWGPMIHRPAGIPMWTNDVQQVAYTLGLDHCLPAQVGAAHNALDDARWTYEAWKYLRAAEAGQEGQR